VSADFANFLSLRSLPRRVSSRKDFVQPPHYYIDYFLNQTRAMLPSGLPSSSTMMGIGVYPLGLGNRNEVKAGSAVIGWEHETIFRSGIFP
jgi:hypothetical protein